MTIDPRILGYEHLLATSLRLADRIDEAATRLETDGEPVTASLPDDLEAFDADLRRLADAISATPDAEPSLDGMRDAVRLLRAELPEVRRLDLFLNLRGVGLQGTGELEDLVVQQRAARSLRAALVDGVATAGPDRERLAAGVHPWCAVHRLVDEQDELSDEDWQSLVSQVREELGPALATAVQRGRIRSAKREIAPPAIPFRSPPIDGNSASFPSRPSAMEPTFRRPPAMPADVVSLPIVEAPAVPFAAPEFVRERVTPVFGPAPADAGPVTAPMPPDTSVRREIVESQHSILDDAAETPAAGETIPESRLLRTAAFEAPRPEYREAASRVLKSFDPVMDGSLSELITSLIIAGRPALASHLAQALDSMGGTGRCWVPEPLLRAWTLCRMVQFPNGAMAAALGREFAALKKISVERKSPEERLAFELLVRAAALRPALVAPETGAAGWLRSFPVQQDRSHLYNYCVRVGSSAERIGGVSPSTMNRSSTPARTDEEIRLLHSDIRQWKRALRSETFRYEGTTPLFQRTHWSLMSGTGADQARLLTRWRVSEEVLRRIDRLLRPIELNQFDKSVEVRRQSELLTQGCASIPEELDEETRDGLKTFVRQAVTYVQRWRSILALGAGNRRLPCQELTELAAEIERRHADVVAEVRELVNRFRDVRVEAAARCLLESLDDVSAMFRTPGSPDLDENDPRHVLNGELLKVIGLKLDHQWEPAAVAAELTRKLVLSLAEPLPNWEMAIRLHEDRRDHEAIERVLSLDHWSPEERKSWQAWVAGRKRRSLEGRWSELDDARLPADESGLRGVEPTISLERVARIRKALTSDDGAVPAPLPPVPTIVPESARTPAETSSGSISRRLRERLLKINENAAESSVFDGD